MMTKADLGLSLIVLATVAGFVIYVYLFPLRRERRKTQRYPLFACRHRIVMLVAEGKIEEDDEVFKFFYESVNYLIPQSKQMGRLAIVKAVVASPIAKLAEPDFRERFLKILNHDDPAVRMVGREFLEALRDKLAKIWSVRVAVKFIDWGLDRVVQVIDVAARFVGGSPRDGARMYTVLSQTADGLT